MSRAVIRSGFTLVEVLVVTVIIGILLALVSAAVFPALQSAKEFAITSEASQLSMAMESLKAEYGTGNPPADLALPSGTDPDDFYNYVVRTFPRFTKDPSDSSGATALTAANLRTYLSGLGVNTSAFDPGNALVFWLVGFSDNPAAPFDGHVDRMNGTKMISPFYEFDIDRLGTDSEGYIRYFPKLAVDDYADADEQRAFLYFDKKCYDADHAYGTFLKPYLKSGSTTTYSNPRGFQIINAGLDGQLGVGGDTYTDADADNLTNFSGGTMGDYTEE